MQERGHRSLTFPVGAGLGHLWGILMYRIPSAITVISPAEEAGYELWVCTARAVTGDGRSRKWGQGQNLSVTSMMFSLGPT